MVLVVSMNSIHVLEDCGAFFEHNIHVEIMMLAFCRLIISVWINGVFVGKCPFVSWKIVVHFKGTPLLFG